MMIRQSGDMDKRNNPVLGVFWMMVTGFTFVGVTATVKHVGDGLPAAQAGFMRYALGLLLLVPMIPAMRRAKFSGADLRLFTIRGLFQVAGVILWFYAMTQISIAEVTAMNYLSPVYVTLGAALFLGERLAARRILAVLAALIGAMIILRPGFREISPGHFAMIGTAIAFGGSYLMMKRLTDKFEAAVIVFMMSVTVTIGLIPFAWMVWVPPSLEQTAWMGLVAVLATFGHYAMTLAFRAAPVTVTQPVTFLQLVWATALGALVFDEPVDAFVVLGGTIILAAVSFITWREAVLKRRMVAPPHVATKY